MGRKCTICNHPSRSDIDTALLLNGSFRQISAQHNVSTGALQRHKNDHLTERLAEVQNARNEALRLAGQKAALEMGAQVFEAQTLLDQVHNLRQKAIHLLDRAEASGDIKTALAGVREARGCLELLAKIEGQLDNRSQVNIAVVPEWVELRTAIIQALEPYPEAREAVMNALP